MCWVVKDSLVNTIRNRLFHSKVKIVDFVWKSKKKSVGWKLKHKHWTIVSKVTELITGISKIREKVRMWWLV